MGTNRDTAVILKLIEDLKGAGSWCGETHIQKTMYFLQEAVGVELGYDFIMYKHGPYSFELSDSLVSLRANGVVELIPQQYPYGPSFALTEVGKILFEKYQSDLGEDIPKIEGIVAKLGKKKVVELERLGTALYVSRKIGAGKDIESRAKQINRLKPHISRTKAIEALREVEEIIA